ncbi:MAG: tryptophan 7-halogenase [Chthoniobacteraceae bacterium]|jgi:flavin-dependent dehydrogenase
MHPRGPDNPAAAPPAPYAPYASYDVVIIGGALSGAAAAILLLRRDPGIRVLIVEKSDRFSRRVGEATVEVSAYFLGRVLGLTQYLNESHLVKQGLRFYFSNEAVASLAESSELGARYQVRLPSYQLDRATLDEEVLRRACAAGATLLRPAAILEVALAPGADQSVTLSHGGITETIRARWVIDASGVAALLARKNGWWRPNLEHPTTACWSRWQGVKDWDGLDLTRRFPEWAAAVYGTRGTATNHIIGDGWWSWWIPLKGGDTSVGVVFDQRLLEWPAGEGRLGDRLKQFLMQHPVAREMLADATYDDADVHWRKNLPYFSTTFAGDGFALVGDAAAFMDPFYSPGMDWIAFTAARAVDLIAAQRAGEPIADLVARHNRDFTQSYRCWFQALYKDKYEYIGEFDLMSIAFLLDLGLYYFGVVSQPFRHGAEAFSTPPFSQPISRPFHFLMSLYNRRFACIARHRRETGMLGRANRSRRCLIPGFTLSRGDLAQLLKGFARWGWLELTEGWRSWGAPAGQPIPAQEPVKRPA